MERTTTSRLGDPQRAEAVDRTRLLGSPLEASYDRITRLAARVLGVPVTMVSVLGADRHFVKSSFGWTNGSETDRWVPLGQSLCSRVVDSGDQLVVDDLRTDERTVGHGSVTDFGIISYAGVPVVVGEHVIGTVCAADQQPHAWTELELATLRDLAVLVTDQLRLASATRATEELQRVRNAHVLQLNEHLHRDLTTARLALDLGEVQQARRAVDTAVRTVAGMIDQIVERGQAASGRGAIGSSVGDSVVGAIASVAAAHADGSDGGTDGIGAIAAAHGLSAREDEVLRCMATGLSNKEIAERLHISVETVKKHVSHVMGKLGVSSRAATIAMVLQRA